MSQLRSRLEPVAAVVACLAVGWGVLFSWLAVTRHLAGGTHAEDLGFTDQVLFNFSRGQWFRMSIYDGASWNTELDVSRVLRPDSLLAFHFEPMLLLLAPLHALGGATSLLVLQSVSVGAGALPTFRLTVAATGSRVAAAAAAAAYLLSPFGQWAVLSDFHTAALAAPLLLFALERLLVAHAPYQSVLLAALAASAREDVGPGLALLGVVITLRTRHLRSGAAFTCIGVVFTAVGLAVIRAYSGGVSPFDVRYGETLGAGPIGALAAITRPGALEYFGTVLLSGAWLGLLSPAALLSGIPSLALNVLSTSPWMAAGKAHYSALVFAFVTVAGIAGLRNLKSKTALIRAASVLLIVTSSVGYVREGAGPLGGNYAAASITDHALRANALARTLPRDASVSASAAVVPRVSSRSHIYVFPAIQSAEFVFLDLRASPAPTSAGDTFLRARDLLASGEWQIDAAEDGLLLLSRAAAALPVDMATLVDILDTPSERADRNTSPGGTGDIPVFARGASSPIEDVRLVSAALVPSPDAALEVDGPRWILRTVWRPDTGLPAGTRLEFTVDLDPGEQLHIWDVAALWWNPPDRWVPGQTVTVDVPDIPAHRFRSWRADWR